MAYRNYGIPNYQDGNSRTSADFEGAMREQSDVAAEVQKAIAEPVRETAEIKASVRAQVEATEEFKKTLLEPDRR